MKLAMIGLGRMGGNMARRLIEDSHEVVAFDRNPAAVAEAVKHGAIAASSFSKIAEQLPSPAIYWIMLPAGQITEDTIGEIAAVAKPGDIVVDGGNSFWKDDIRRSKLLA